MAATHSAEREATTRQVRATEKKTEKVLTAEQSSPQKQGQFPFKNREARDRDNQINLMAVKEQPVVLLKKMRKRWGGEKKSMKNNVLKIMFIVIGIIMTSGIIFYSCQKETNTVAEKSTLQQELATLNKSIKLNTIETKGSSWWDRLGRAAAIAGADIVGFGAGVYTVKEIAGAIGVATGGTGALVVMGAAGLICGAGASYAAGSSLPGNHGNGNPEYPFVLDYNSYGYMHNEVLAEVFVSNETTVNNWIRVNMSQYSNDILNVLNTNEYKNNYDKITTYAALYAENGDINEYISSLCVTANIPENVKLVYVSFFEKYLQATNIEDLMMVVDLYKDFVKSNTVLSLEEKDCLLSSLSIAEYSPFYWLSDTEN